MTEQDEPRPREIYGRSKWEGEKILLARSDLAAVILRTPTIVASGRLGLLASRDLRQPVGALLRCFIVAGSVGGLWLRLGPRRAPDHILGWRIMSNTPSVVVFGVESFTLTARLVVEVDASSVVHATFVRYDRRLGRVAWRVAAPIHRRIIPFLLQRASRILAVSAGTS